MIYNAIIKDGGIFIPNVDNKILKKSKTRIDIVFVDNINKDENIILKTKGIIKGKVQDGLEYEKIIRDEWDK
ncbi:MAG: hypothetical protein A2086_10195 [Spirochaetes bacterium GWD1_27_9]|nr:MAG: hypothetical protein A2Z98_11770 [Spirochaetes bacterium GWB1_27_13]OHD27899.1 MAG: hypothetical protein A2Y34_14650 [Spirochaetes bacterium GWC1_27_15]OHD35867.1 MAG: hypothetical protein A2086_10195 [Spirochaetes bacterium GWD1_27_9]